MTDRADGLVTTGRAAEAVGVNARSLARWAQKGLVKPSIRTPGGHPMWDVEELRKQLLDMGALR